MSAFFKASAFAVMTASLAAAVPASAAPIYDAEFYAPGDQSYGHSYDRGRERYSREDWRRGYRTGYRDYDDRGYRDARVWRGNDGRYYCRRSNGTTGLIVGGALGALLGHEIDGGRDHTAGTLLGAAGGALLGREIDRGGARCR